MIAMIFVVGVAVVTVLLQAIRIDRITEEYEKTAAMLEIEKFQKKVIMTSLDNLWDVNRLSLEHMNKMVNQMCNIMEGKATPEEAEDTELFVKEWVDFYPRQCEAHEMYMRQRQEKDKEE